MISARKLSVRTIQWLKNGAKRKGDVACRRTETRVDFAWRHDRIAGKTRGKASLPGRYVVADLPYGQELDDHAVVIALDLLLGGT